MNLELRPLTATELQLRRMDRPAWYAHAHGTVLSFPAHDSVMALRDIEFPFNEIRLLFPDIRAKYENQMLAYRIMRSHPDTDAQTKTVVIAKFGNIRIPAVYMDDAKPGFFLHPKTKRALFQIHVQPGGMHHVSMYTYEHPVTVALPPGREARVSMQYADETHVFTARDIAAPVKQSRRSDIELPGGMIESIGFEEHIGFARQGRVLASVYCGKEKGSI